MFKKLVLFYFILINLSALSGCQSPANETAATETEIPTDSILKEAAALEADLSPAVNNIIKPEASGTMTASNEYAAIDYSHSEDGYVMVRFTDASTKKRIKSQIVGPETTYTYNLMPGEWEVFPLSDGNGRYQINVFENIVDTRYLQVLSEDIEVTLKDEFAPFIRPNQYVNYENAAITINTAAILTKDITDTLEKVGVIYEYVIKHISYDYEKAQNIESGYLPDLDQIMNSKKGICFDYASLMTGMLRSQGVPSKLVLGYAGTTYHAWIDVWSEETGWINEAVFFDGITWHRMDPTYADTNGDDSASQQYITDSSNYTTKYIY